MPVNNKSKKKKTFPQKKIPDTSTKSPEVSDTDETPPSTATPARAKSTIDANILEEINNLLEIQNDKLYKKLSNEISDIKKYIDNEISKVMDIAQAAYDLAAKHADKIELLESQNARLKTQLHEVRTVEFDAVAEQIEERTNRTLRKTLVFTGIPEGNEPSWKETESLLAKTIADTCDIELTDAAAMIERCHRSAPSKRKNAGPRPIFAACYDWKDTELLKDGFRKQNMTARATIYCNQKYGPLTTARRNMALQTRKTLKADNKIVSAFIKYPAQLMVKTEHGKDVKYHLHKDFSKEKVTLK